jgi:hypothetical protein
MHLRGFIVFASTVLTLSAFAQDGQRKANVSKDPLTDEQVAVYRAVLRNYMKESDGPLNVSNRTGLLQLSRPFFDKQCIEGIVLDTADNSVPVVHKLTPAVAINSKIALVDPERQQRKIESNGPEVLIHKAIDDHKKVTEKDSKDSVKATIATGLFTLSEIVFDRPHRHALVSYSFVCGGLCGNGSILVLEKVGDNWKVTKTCGGWIS